jgi:glycosyltransferase involved in cell wall biosynthesis
MRREKKKKMKIAVVSAFEADAQFAHVINTVKLAGSFAHLGHEVTMICLQSPKGAVPADVLQKSMGCPASLRWIQLPRYLGTEWRFAWAALFLLFCLKIDLIFSRSYYTPYLSSKFKWITVGESHAHPGNTSKAFMRYVSGTQHHYFAAWVTISDYLAKHYTSLGVPSDKIMVLPDAVDLTLFQHPKSLPESPYPPTSRKKVVYAGHLYDYKGIPTILKAAHSLQEFDFHLVGGLPEDLQRQQKRAADMNLKNIRFHGQVPHSQVPPYLWHADVLLLPPSAKHPSAKWTSPVKAGEYFASGTPVMASDIPALRDWMTAEEVLFFSADSWQAMSEGIKRLLYDEKYSKRLVRNAACKAESLSYDHRAKQILTSPMVNKLLKSCLSTND